ncbi:hypothetical protein CRG98_017322 [Punica granatum]|uniref:Uncharacterized protein n=1 Tax=Punica granatum TaxID=22663 RepID=A0A2I0K181_PUNGR|nr:hypothetical protein CRG98_017322 [Punica granatum]
MEKGDGSGKRVEVPAVYHLTSSDGPGNQITASKLNSDNYLKCFRVTDYVKGQEQATFHERTVKEDLQSSVADAMDAKNLWDDLKERYSQ